jgi:cytosol alanyl aminopeptidase
MAKSSGAPEAERATVPIFRLPADVHPTRERVELEVVPDRPTFRGKVQIELTLDQPREDLFVSARGLTLDAGTLTAGTETLPVRFELDDARGVARLVLPHGVPAGPAMLQIAFEGTFNPRLAGLYRVKSRNRWYAFTQFEAVDARRAFPCFDEPAMKIPWELTLLVPGEAVAVANAPELDRAPAGELTRVRFRPTRPLPSYLVAFAVGDFDVVSPPPLPPNAIRKHPLPVRGVATHGRGAELAYAMKAGADLLVMLEEWYGVPFPYEKLDHLAVPDFEAGAMENAGLITYREPALLVDEATASSAQRQNVVVDVSHEIAHQWFGDLVTMAWWDDLWLNESFADLMETQITAAYLKDSRYDLVHQKVVHGAMFSEELSGVNPIVPVLRTEPDIFGFDYGIVYQKGGQVLEMFQSFLGEEKFRHGIRRYLEAHRDGNATRADLMKALAEEGTDLGPALSSFVEQPGVPLVHGELRCDGRAPRVHLTQTRQRPLGSPLSDGQRWEIPVCVHTSSTGAHPDCMLLRDAEADLPLRSKSCPAWFALNADARGYYRWMLPPDQLRALLKKGYGSLRPTERLSLASNLTAAFRSGTLTAADTLAALGPVAHDAEPSVAQEPGSILRLVREQFLTPQERPAVEAYMRKLYGPVLARVGWTPRPGEPGRQTQFRAWLVRYLAMEANDRTVLNRAAALGRAYLGTDGRLHPEAVNQDLVGVALEAAGRTGDAALFQTLLQRLKAADDSNVRENLLVGLGQFRDPALAEQARMLAMQEGLRVNERGYVLTAQTVTLEQRPGAWSWLKANVDQYAPRMPDTYVQFLAYAQAGCGEADAKDLQDGLGPHIARYAGATYTLKKAVEKTRLCGALADRQRESARQFFRTHGASGPTGPTRGISSVQ